MAYDGVYVIWRGVLFTIKVGLRQVGVGVH